MPPLSLRVGLAAGLLLSLVVGCGNAGEPVAEVVRAATTDHSKKKTAALAGATPDRWDESVWARPPAVAPRVSRPSPQELEPDRVLFLPLLNRTTYRLHAYFLRGFDRTLAAHAAIHLERPVVDPELAWEVAREAKMPEPLASAMPASPRPEVLSRLARRTGAGVVVWGEILAEGAVKLHAMAVHPEGDGSPWKGVHVELVRPAEVGLHDGPRAVVAEVQARVGVPSSATPAPPEAEAALEAALAHAWSGRAAATREAELALADLAVEHPSWPRPLVELAALRMTRSFTFDGPYTQAWLGEGPLVPRHLALLFPDLDPVARARLHATDVIALDQQVPEAERMAAVDALPADDLLRAVHAAAAEFHAREPFGLEGLHPTGGAAEWLVTSERRRSQDLVGVVEERARSLGLAALLRQDAVVGVLLRAAASRNDRAAQRTVALFRVPGGVARALTAARGACQTAPPPADARCREILHGFLAADLPDLPPASLDDSLDPAVDAWAARFLEPGREGLQQRLPRLRIFEQDPAFATAWDASKRLGEVVGEALRTAETARGATAAARDMLVADVRHEIRRGRAALAETAFKPASVGWAKPYLDALAGLDLQVPEARHAWLQIKWELSDREWFRENYQRLIGVEPWHSDWVWTWIDRWGFENQDARATARFLDRILPRPQLATRIVAHAWHQAGESEKAREILEAALDVAPQGAQFTQLDDVMVALDEPLAVRRKMLEVAAERLPAAQGVRSHLAWAHLWGEEWDEADALFETLLPTWGYHRTACDGMATTAFGRGDAARALAVVRRCQELAQDRWRRAEAWIAEGDLLRHAGQLDRADAAYREAEKLVGRTFDLNFQIGFLRELQGRLDEAREVYELVERRYSKGTAAFYLALLDLREGRLEAAHGRLRKALRSGHWLSWDATLLLGRLEARAGTMGRFLELASAKGTSPAHPLAQLRARIGGDAEGAIADLASRLREDVTESERREIHILRTRLLLEAGRADEALAEVERGLEEQRAWDLLVLRVRTLVESDRMDEARRARDAFAARWPASVQMRLMQYHVLRGEGDRDGARRALRWLWEHRSPHDMDHVFAWWEDALDWLELEIALGLERTSRDDLAWLRERAEEAVEQLPWRPEAWTALARVRDALGDAEGAAEAQRMAADLGGGVAATRLSAAAAP